MIDEAIRKLLSDTNISKAELKKRFRKLSMKHHPDRGGDPEKFITLKEVYEKCLKQLDESTDKSTKCSLCRGTGRSRICHVFGNVTLNCPVCKGSGLKM